LGLITLLLTAAVSDSVPREFVTAHNSYRAKFRTPPLAWSNALAGRAREWAATLVNRGTFGPRWDGRFGENIFEISNGRATPTDVVAGWMSEAANYNPKTNACSARCGHFTQVIWRDTKLVGCAVARNRTREVWVCDYDPPGNVLGEHPY
jgi:pathogenesis-related protein 1